MSTPVPVVLSCRCGTLRGQLSLSRDAGAPAVCHCDDCQTFGRWLDPDILDNNGGTAIVQTWPARVELTEGLSSLSLCRLSPKGLLRWYAGCCRTPVANCLPRAGLPFVGIQVRFLAPGGAELIDEMFGPAPRFQGRFVTGGCPPDVHPKAPVGVLVNGAATLARGWWSGGARPHPFLDSSGRPVREATVLTREERDAHRPPA